MNNYELIDHTADIGIKVKSLTLKGLFIDSAKALFDVMVEAPKAFGRKALQKKCKITLKESSLKELYVRWLSELVSLSDSKDVIFTDFDISELTDTTLQARVSGPPRKYFPSKREIKAVTYHDLKIAKKGGRYTAEVIFDV